MLHIPYCLRLGRLPTTVVVLLCYGVDAIVGVWRTVLALIEAMRKR